MSKTLFITGTGTDVGKTYVSGLILKELRSAGENAGYFKAAMSGNSRRQDGSLIPGDAAAVKAMSGIDQSLEAMCPYVYEAAVSPHLASRLEGNPVRAGTVKAAYDAAAGEYDYILAEGSGGILCPLSFDGEKLWLEDVIRSLGCPCLIVADAGLGTINTTALTAFYMKSAGIPVKGMIFNRFHPGDVMEEDNIKMCEYLTGLKTIARVKDGDDRLGVDSGALTALFE